MITNVTIHFLTTEISTLINIPTHIEIYIRIYLNTLCTGTYNFIVRLLHDLNYIQGKNIVIENTGKRKT